MMNRRAKSDSIPMDLIPEILSRLPAKAVARFRCVSKPWKSIISRQDFTDLFRTMSSSKPRLLTVVKQGGERSFYSCPRPHNHYGKSSLVAAADFHTKFSKVYAPSYFSYASGLFYFPNRLLSEVHDDVISNPSTGQYVILPPDLRPDLRTYCNRGGFLGFDPIGKQFKVLVVNRRVDDGFVYHILTLGTEKVWWREIKGPSFYYGHHNSGICINGVLYYIAHNKIFCFDVRSEKFNFLTGHGIRYDQNLINYKGKLCRSKLEYGYHGGFPIKLSMWILEDSEKMEWSPYAYTLSAENKGLSFRCWDDYF